MSEAKLKAKLFVHAAIRRCDLECLPAVVSKRGDDDAGTVLVRVNRARDQVEIYTQVRDAAGRLTWLKATGPDPVGDDKADAYVARARDVDYDLWVIEIDSPKGRVPFIEDSL